MALRRGRETGAPVNDVISVRSISAACRNGRPVWSPAPPPAKDESDRRQACRVASGAAKMKVQTSTEVP